MGLVLEVTVPSPAPAVSAGMDPGHRRVWQSGGGRDIGLAVAASGSSRLPFCGELPATTRSPQAHQEPPGPPARSSLSAARSTAAVGLLTDDSLLVSLRRWGPAGHAPAFPQPELARETCRATEHPHGARPGKGSVHSGSWPPAAGPELSRQEWGHTL